MSGLYMLVILFFFLCMILLAGLAVSVLLIGAIIYSCTQYSKEEKENYLKVRFDTGKYGEYLVYKKLRNYEKSGAKFLFNCYLPCKNDATTEVDLIMLHTSGIYVLESKNYSGWIFGDDKKMWTQSLHVGRGKTRKEHFYNPIYQNMTHIKGIYDLLGQESLCHSLIVFSERCELMSLDLKWTNAHVLKRNELKRTVEEIMRGYPNVLSQEDVDMIYSKLYPYTKVEESVKEKHIERIKQKTIKSENVEIDDYKYRPPNTCPRCGGELVLRTVRRGENSGAKFYGCKSYPKCKFTKPV